MTLNIQNTIRSEALKSKCNQKHGCVITKGNTKIMSVGYNNNHRSSYSISYFKNNKIIKINVKEPCIHAELSGVKNFINIMSKKNKRKMINYNKYIVWVGRIPNDENKRNLGELKNSRGVGIDISNKAINIANKAINPKKHLKKCKPTLLV